MTSPTLLPEYQEWIDAVLLHGKGGQDDVVSTLLVWYIDTGVHMGPHHAADFLQRWLNGFNDSGAHYQDLFVDGQIGNLTLAALKAFLKRRGSGGVTVMMDALNSLQATRYLNIVEADKSQRKYLYGWMRKRVHL